MAAADEKTKEDKRKYLHLLAPSFLSLSLFVRVSCWPGAPACVVCEA